MRRDGGNDMTPRNMTPRKKLRAIMAGKKLVLMPGAYDALSARVIESEGFEAIVAGGYAGVGSMLAQADMGQSNMRDYAGHYGRICDAVEIPVYVDADTGAGGGPQGAQSFGAGSRWSLLRHVPVDRTVCRGSRGTQRRPSAQA